MSDLFTNDASFVYDPLKQYQSVYRSLHHDNTVAYIDALIAKSGVNVELNQVTNREIDKAENKLLTLLKSLTRKKVLRTILIILTVLGVISLIIGIAIANLDEVANYVPFLLGGIGLFVAAGCLLLLILKIKPAIQQLLGAKKILDEQIAELKAEAWKQMNPLNELFKEGMQKEIFQKTLPLIELDPYFDSRRLDYLHTKFGMSKEDSNARSTLYTQSGQIMGNPFFLGRDLIHYMGTKTYTGSLVITYTTSSYVNGRYVTQTRTQTLHASLTKPYPYYYELPYLVYGNEAAPDLSFDRDDSDAEKMTEKQIEREVKRETKKLEKKAERSVMKGGDFTVMGNSEFEVLFGATNRDNEVQFRLLFTPLAQKQLLDLMKDKTIAYGDDFDFKKRKMINIVYPEHLQNAQLAVAPSYFYGYDIDDIRTRFVDYNNTYFKQVYFTFAPILAIPIYQHQKPQEYIYKDFYPSYASFYEHEQVVNRMNLEAFIHPLSRTRNILKTKVVSSANHCDQLQVDAYGFRTEEHVDYVPVFGNDGRSHNVPVHWTEYLPVEQRTEVAINVPETETSEGAKTGYQALLERLQQEGEKHKGLKKIGLLIATLKNDLLE